MFSGKAKSSRGTVPKSNWATTVRAITTLIVATSATPYLRFRAAIFLLNLLSTNQSIYANNPSI